MQGAVASCCPEVVVLQLLFFTRWAWNLGNLLPALVKCLQLKSANTGRLLPFPSPTLHWTQNAMTSRLHFKVDGVILDQQDKKATQRLINEHFNTPLLRHAVFYGQNEVTSILEVGWA